MKHASYSYLYKYVGKGIVVSFASLSTSKVASCSGLFISLKAEGVISVNRFGG